MLHLYAAIQRGCIAFRLNVHGSNETTQVIDRIRAHLAAHPIAGVRYDIAGFGQLFPDQTDRIVNGQMKSFALSFLHILLLMALLFRSLKTGLICLIPNLAPLFFILVVMGMSGMRSTSPPC